MTYCAKRPDLAITGFCESHIMELRGSGGLVLQRLRYAHKFPMAAACRAGELLAPLTACIGAPCNQRTSGMTALLRL